MVGAWWETTFHFTRFSHELGSWLLWRGLTCYTYNTKDNLCIYLYTHMNMYGYIHHVYIYIIYIPKGNTTICTNTYQTKMNSVCVACVYITFIIVRLQKTCVRSKHSTHSQNAFPKSINLHLSSNLTFPSFPHPNLPPCNPRPVPRPSGNQLVLLVPRLSHDLKLFWRFVSGRFVSSGNLPEVCASCLWKIVKLYQRTHHALTPKHPENVWVKQTLFWCWFGYD